MVWSCTKCYARRRTVGQIESHVEDEHDPDNHLTEYYEQVDVDESSGSRATFLKDFS